MFLQIHFLTSYHATLLNRDDAGLAKRIVFGGTPRLRVSSQCQKRHWREWMTSQMKLPSWTASQPELPSGTRSRLAFERIVYGDLVREGLDPELTTALVEHLASKVLRAAEGKDALMKGSLAMSQPVLFGRPETSYFTSIVREAAQRGSVDAARVHIEETIDAIKKTKNLDALLRQNGFGNPAAGFEGAMFGRFVTSALLARVDAPVHVSHAFTTHALDTEVDFFTVVDDLAEDSETGAAHANDMELGAGIFYGYVAVDVPLLVSNLTGCEAEDWRDQDPAAARSLLSLLVQAAAEVSPGAKLGATAPYARAECVLLEVGDEQPRSLANAFLEPVRLGQRQHPMGQSVTAMAEYAHSLDAMYGSETRRFVASLHSWPGDGGTSASFPESSNAAFDAIFEARP